MTQYGFLGESILGRIEQLEPALRNQVLDDLEVLRHDPENLAGDTHSPIEPYKDPTYGHTYTLVLAGGRFLLKYTVYQDYPIVWLRVLLDTTTGETTG